MHDNRPFECCAFSFKSLREDLKNGEWLSTVDWFLSCWVVFVISSSMLGLYRPGNFAQKVAVGIYDAVGRVGDMSALYKASKFSALQFYTCMHELHFQLP